MIMISCFACSCFTRKNNSSKIKRKIVAKKNTKVEVVFNVCGFLGNVVFSVSHWSYWTRYVRSKLEIFFLYFLTCSYAMNLIAVSGAIFMTLTPLPRHREATPPSLIICLNPPTRLILLDFEE